LTGLLPHPGEPTVTDWFIDGTMPTIQGPYTPPTIGCGGGDGHHHHGNGCPPNPNPPPIPTPVPPPCNPIICITP
jgi:hypothetical protein